MYSIQTLFKRILPLLVAVLLCVGCSKIPTTLSNPWQVIQLPSTANLQDIAFTGNPQHGWIVGSEATLLETTDGGSTWQQKPINLEEDTKARLTSVSFSGKEGWIIGEPSILLHSNNEGQTWERIPLSSKLPGTPLTILALGPNSAEMTTNVGAIYKTSDGGQNWKALVQEAVGVVRNIQRSADGKYVAVSAKGNFYSVWEPGQNAWTPHNRNSSRRVQNMGFTPDGNLWMLARGGQVQFTNPENSEEWEKAVFPELSTSWGLLDLAYRNSSEVWLAGGSGQLLCSLDGGKTWQKDRAVEEVPSNFYKIVFVSPDSGFIIGQQGILLKYQQTSAAA
jgi:photosystem II stability/assembly factor-like uncharacterized protein